jgi:hypothetical protein
MRQYTAARRNEHCDPDERLSPLLADCPMTFTPPAAEPEVCAVPLTIGVAIPRHFGIDIVSLEGFLHSAFLGLRL